MYQAYQSGRWGQLTGLNDTHQQDNGRGLTVSTGRTAGHHSNSIQVYTKIVYIYIAATQLNTWIRDVVTFLSLLNQ